MGMQNELSGRDVQRLCEECSTHTAQQINQSALKLLCDHTRQSSLGEHELNKTKTKHAVN